MSLQTETLLNQLKTRVTNRADNLGAIGLLEELISYNWESEVEDFLEQDEVGRHGHVLNIMLALEKIFSPDNYKDSLIYIEKRISEERE